MNRAARRKLGIRVRVAPSHDTIIPRYARRHMLTSKPVNRRQRKARARIVRTVLRIGL